MRTWQEFVLAVEVFGGHGMQNIHQMLQDGRTPIAKDRQGNRYEIHDFNSESVGLRDLKTAEDFRMPRYEFENRLLDRRITMENS